MVQQSWTAGLAQDTANRALRRRRNALVGRQSLPLNQFPVFNIQGRLDGEELTHSWRPTIWIGSAHPNYDDYWKQWSIEENYAIDSGSGAE